MCEGGWVGVFLVQVGVQNSEKSSTVYAPSTCSFTLPVTLTGGTEPELNVFVIFVTFG